MHTKPAITISASEDVLFGLIKNNYGTNCAACLHLPVIVFSNCQNIFAEQQKTVSTSDPGAPLVLVTRLSTITTTDHDVGDVTDDVIDTTVTFTPEISNINPTTVTVTDDDDVTTSVSEEESKELEDDSEEIGDSFIVTSSSAKFEQLKRGGKKNSSDEEEEEKSLEDERHSAELSFKERLRARFKKFRQEHVGVLNKKNPSTSTFNRKQNIRENDKEDEEENDDKEEKKRPKFGKNGRTDLIRKKLAEVLKHTTTVSESFLERTFVPSISKSEVKTSTTRIRPTNVRNLFNIDASTRSPFSFQRNKGLKRPTIRKNLLSRVLGKTVEEEQDDSDDTTENSNKESEIKTELPVEPSPTTRAVIVKSTEHQVSIVTPSVIVQTDTINADDDEEVEEVHEEEPKIVLQSSIEEVDDIVTLSSSTPTPSVFVIKPTSEEVTVAPIEKTIVGDESTINVATEEHSGVLMEVATIKSAYSFIAEDDLLSTRFITITRTLPTSTAGPEIDLSTLHVSTIVPESGSQYLEVATIKSPYSFLVSDSSSESTRYVTVTRTFTGDDIVTRDSVTRDPFTRVPEETSLPFDIIDFKPSPTLSTTVLQEILSR